MSLEDFKNLFYLSPSTAPELKDIESPRGPAMADIVQITCSARWIRLSSKGAIQRGLSSLDFAIST